MDRELDNYYEVLILATQVESDTARGAAALTLGGKVRYGRTVTNS